MKTSYSKRKKRLPFKSRSHTWHAASGSSDNLVISFSEDDSESEHEDTMTEGQNQAKVDTIASKPLQGSSLADLRTVLAQKSLNSKMRPPQARGSVNSLGTPSDHKVTGGSSTDAGSGVFHENEARLQKYDLGKCQEVSGISQNQGGNLPRETAVQQNEFKSQKFVNQSERRHSSLHGDLCEHTDVNSETHTCIYNRHVVGNPVSSTADEQEVKRLKLGENSHVKLAADENNNKAKWQMSQAHAGLQANPSVRHQYLPQTDMRRGMQHGVNDGIISFPSKVLNNRAKIQRVECQIVENAGTISQNGNICSRQADHHSSGAGMSASHNQLNTSVSQAASSGLISDLQHIEDASTKQSKVISESLLGTTNMDQSAMLNFLGHDSMDIDSLMKLEELKDEELEEAQEIRRRCELAERQALKAYREAQRALMDANERCSLLYRKRELFSAHLRTLLMDGANRQLSLAWPGRARTQLDSIDEAPRASTVPSSGQDYEVVDKDLILKIREKKSEVKCRNDACNTEQRDQLHIESSKQLLLGHSFSSQLCFNSNIRGPFQKNSNIREPVTKFDSVLDGGDHSSSLLNMSTKEDQQNLLVCCDSSGLACEDENRGLKLAAVDMETEMMSASENARDFELEATLRSKLCARFSKKPSNGDHGRSETAAVVTKVDANVFNEKEPAIQGEGHMHLIKEVSSDEMNDTLLGVHSLGRCEVLSSSSPGRQPRNGCFGAELYVTDTASIYSLPSSVLQTVSRHLKFMLAESNNGQEKGKQCNSSDQLDILKNDAQHCMRMPRITLMDSYHCDLVIDPFWPFCMFDLRGRCNDPECQWQHFRDCSLGEQHNIKHATVSGSDAVDGPTVRSVSKSSQGVNGSAVFIPTYRIGSNLIKAENLPCESLLARSNWHYWQMSFCTSFFLPFSIQRLLPSDVPVLHGYGGHPDDDNLKRQSVSLSQDQGRKLFTHGLTDVEQALELAIDLFNTKTNKTLGRKKALSILSRSLEANPSSPILWVVYLSIYYRKEKDLGDDDMFLLAVQHNENSYDLWLMYINSRMQFDSRIDAYNEALYTFCHTKHDFNNEYISACIMDLFLQMMDFLQMSGNEKIAISRIYGLLDPSKDSEAPANILLIDIASCLVAHDRCIFWICCIYFAAYQKLPQGIVQQFEFEKDIPFEMEWPIVQLTSSEKHLAMELMRMALDNLDLNSDGISSSKHLAHFVAISHIRFVVAIQGLESSVSLLDRYLSKYPTCIELIKLSAHCRRLLNLDLGFECFEQALHDWPRETPGVQCLWNQYAGYALDCNRLDIGEELMVRWFSHFCKVLVPESEKGMGGGESGSADFSLGCTKNGDSDVSGPADLPSPALWTDAFCYNQDDLMFGFLNLHFYEQMKGNTVKAHVAIDRALKEATVNYFRHCVREHSSFYLARTIASLDSISSARVVALLNGYLGDIRYSPQSQLLSRRCYPQLKKPRLRHLIDSLLGPVSADCSLMNSILDEYYGPSLLPEKLIEPKNLIDHVEHLIEISPANYKLAISAYKWATKSSENGGPGAAGIMFWASALLVNSILQSLPVAPEHAWVEAVDLLGKLGINSISERFHHQGLSVYPFSKKLWQSYYHLSKIIDRNPSFVIEAARERGIELT